MHKHRFLGPSALLYRARVHLLTHRDRELRDALDRVTECERALFALRDLSGPLASHAECASTVGRLVRIASTASCNDARARLGIESKRTMRALALRLDTLAGGRHVER